MRSTAAPGPTLKTHAAVTGGGSALRRYSEVIVGTGSIRSLLYHEFCMLFRNTPGALGLVLRKLFWPRLFASCGKGVVFGGGISLRQPRRIRLGDQVVISEQCVLDGRHRQGAGVAMEIGDGCILADKVILQCKGARIRIGRNVGFGPWTLVQTTTDAEIVIGDDAMIGPRCTIVGAGNYRTDRLDLPMRRQGIKEQPGIEVGTDVWMGCSVTVLTGSVIGRGSILGAGAVVRGQVPELAIMAGVPARQIGSRAGRTGKEAGTEASTEGRPE